MAIEGDLDDPTSERLRDQLGVFLDEGCRRLVVDLRHTVSIGSTGMRALVGIMRNTEERGGTLVVRAPPAEVYELGRVRLLSEVLAAVDDAVQETEDMRRLDRLLCGRD